MRRRTIRPLYECGACAKTWRKFILKFYVNRHRCPHCGYDGSRLDDGPFIVSPGRSRCGTVTFFESRNWTAGNLRSAISELLHDHPKSELKSVSKKIGVPTHRAEKIYREIKLKIENAKKEKVLA